MRIEALPTLKGIVSDWYGPYSTNAAINPTGPTTGTERVHRGGSFNRTNRDDFTSRVRGHDAPTGSAYYLGVRCAATPR
jgi:sulfatase modifying factor 1